MNYTELLNLLQHSQTVNDIDVYRKDIAELIPEVSIMFDFDQQHSAHFYDLWFHSLHTIINLPKEKNAMLYLAALLHDIGKPECQTEGIRATDHNMHYQNHAKKSMEIADKIISNLRKQGNDISDNDEKRLLYYIEYHDYWVNYNEQTILYHLSKGISFSTFQNLMELEIADAIAHNPIQAVLKRVEICTKLAGPEGLQLYKGIII